ncbi:MAG: hypothetical protein HY205_05085 [Nitrospirae bacterium]|nr:hypothetical protein [Nitrospirota bacterium]
MLQLLRDAIGRVEALQRELSRLKAAHVNSETDKQAIRAVVDEYFRSIRPSIAIYPALAGELGYVDSTLQNILLLSHRRSTVAAYRKLLGQCKKALVALDTLALTQAHHPSNAAQKGGVDGRILETLQRLLPSAAAAYEQALLDLEQKRISYRGPATDLREALRETLDHLAPDVAVTKQQGYKVEPNTNGPTMKQKVRYVLLSRGMSRTLTEPSERAADAVDEAVGAFVRSVYSRSSLSTHTPTDRDEVLRIRDWVRVVMCELLEIRGA